MNREVHEGSTIADLERLVQDTLAKRGINFGAASSQERKPLFQPMRVSPENSRLWQVPDAVNENGCDAPIHFASTGLPPTTSNEDAGKTGVEMLAYSGDPAPVSTKEAQQ